MRMTHGVACSSQVARYPDGQHGRGDRRSLAASPRSLSSPGSAKAVPPRDVPGGGHRLAVDADRVVDAAHDEIARDRPPQGGPDRGHLLEDLLGAVGPRAAGGLARARTPSMTLAARLARRPAAQVLVLADDDLVEGAAPRSRRTRAGPRRAGRPGCR